MQVPRLRQPTAPAAGTGRPPEYCAGRGHTRLSAWRERRGLAAEQAGTTISPAEDGSPLTTAKMTGAELLRSSLQLLLFPMLFVSGALFPLSACPAGRRGSGQLSHSASPGS